MTHGHIYGRLILRHELDNTGQAIAHRPNLFSLNIAVMYTQILQAQRSYFLHRLQEIAFANAFPPSEPCALGDFLPSL
jgi:hypothetical protein